MFSVSSIFITAHTLLSSVLKLLNFSGVSFPLSCFNISPLANKCAAKSLIVSIPSPLEAPNLKALRMPTYT